MFAIAAHATQDAGAPALRAAYGYTLIELLIAVAVLGVLLAVGIPGMSKWVLASKAAAATELYAEGFKLARLQAQTHNAATRIVLTQNAVNGQMDWRVDLCFPAPGVPCSDLAGSWSTIGAPADGDPQGAAGFKSVFRSAATLPTVEVLVPTVAPAGTANVYFTSTGWVDTTFAQRLTRIRFDPAARYAADLRASALQINLAGTVTKCDPLAGAADSRACPP